MNTSASSGGEENKKHSMTSNKQNTPVFIGDERTKALQVFPLPSSSSSSFSLPFSLATNEQFPFSVWELFDHPSNKQKVKFNCCQRGEGIKEQNNSPTTASTTATASTITTTVTAKKRKKNFPLRRGPKSISHSLANL